MAASVAQLSRNYSQTAASAAQMLIGQTAASAAQIPLNFSQTAASAAQTLIGQTAASAAQSPLNYSFPPLMAMPPERCRH